MKRWWKRLVGCRRDATGRWVAYRVERRVVATASGAQRVTDSSGLTDMELVELARGWNRLEEQRAGVRPQEM